MTQCKLKSPGFVSRPHFYLADQSYVEQFQFGVRPDPKKHESVFWVEPLTSIPFKAWKFLGQNKLYDYITKQIGGDSVTVKHSPEKSSWN